MIGAMRWMVACLGVLLALAVAAWVWQGAAVSDVVPARPLDEVARTNAPNGAADAQHDAAATAPGERADTTPKPHRTAATEPGLSGVVLDDRGEVIPGVLVYLRRDESRFAGAEMQCADGDGCFVFREVVGRCVLTVENGLVEPTELTMGLGEWRFVELRATVPCIVLEGRVRAGITPVVGRRVAAKGGDSAFAANATTDGEGRFGFVLRAGKYDVQLARAAVVAGQFGDARDPLSLRRELVLDGASRRVQCDFTIPSASLRITVVESATRRPVPDVPVRASCGERMRAAATAADGTALLGELDSGRWRVACVPSETQMAVAQDIEIDAAATTPYPVILEVALAGALRVVTHRKNVLELREAAKEQDEAVAGGAAGADAFGPVDPTHLSLHLRSGEVVRAFGMTDDPIPPGAGKNGLPFQGVVNTGLPFVHVPPGLHQLVQEDKVDTAGITYGVYEPFAVPVDVRPGEVTTVQPPIARRPTLQILVADRDGKAMTLLPVITGAQGRVVFSTWWGGGWKGPVRPGTYRIVVDEPQGRHEESVVVGAQDVQHVLRVPWQAAAAGAIRDDGK